VRLIGLEHASMFAAPGTKVTAVERRLGMLEVCDGEILESLRYLHEAYRHRPQTSTAPPKRNRGDSRLLLACDRETASRGGPGARLRVDGRRRGRGLTTHLPTLDTTTPP
jgi:pyruvate/2-oxoglutarate dehydrogenase complex dihydrolipoamide dehydrogenase (E3) component